MFRSQVDLRDDEGPVLGEPSGGLVAGETLTGAAASVTFGAQDEGGGVASLALLVDGAEVARRDVGGACAEPYTEPEPCPSSYSATLTADLSALADGTHTATLRATRRGGHDDDRRSDHVHRRARAGPAGPTGHAGHAARHADPDGRRGEDRARHVVTAAR